ncbi:hypothetical protein [Hansschlegelia sp.]|uniref:helix-turn-helix domain-containing protein n=1 Tax=Hansschlegelia sp. TaxID=2041892 RepID=UPI002B955490|nr:hypothetical protein [Hansschlegelia sp.]HVI30418.1 hypothetical protein [Hansschlegelia sp.]
MADAAFYIPAALKAELDALFDGTWLASHPKVAALLRISDKTLKQLGDDGLIRYRLRGRVWRVYAREDIEAYVGAEPCPSTARNAETAPTARSSGTSTSSSRHRTGQVVVFTAALARERARKRSASRLRSES